MSKLFPIYINDRNNLNHYFLVMAKAVKVFEFAGRKYAIHRPYTITGRFSDKGWVCSEMSTGLNLDGGKTIIDAWVTSEIRLKNYRDKIELAIKRSMTKRKKMIQIPNPFEVQT